MHIFRSVINHCVYVCLNSFLVDSFGFVKQTSRDYRWPKHGLRSWLDPDRFDPRSWVSRLDWFDQVLDASYDCPVSVRYICSVVYNSWFRDDRLLFFSSLRCRRRLEHSRRYGRKTRNREQCWYQFSLLNTSISHIHCRVKVVTWSIRWCISLLGVRTTTTTTATPLLATSFLSLSLLLTGSHWPRCRRLPHEVIFRVSDARMETLKWQHARCDGSGRVTRGFHKRTDLNLSPEHVRTPDSSLQPTPPWWSMHRPS